MTTKTLRNVLLLLSLIGAFYTHAQTDENRASNASNSNQRDLRVEILPTDINIIEVPEGFEPSDVINGYIHKLTGTSIVISKIIGVNYINMGKSMSNEYFAQQGLTLVEKSDLQSGFGASGLIYKTTLTSEGIDYTRYFVYVGGLNNTIWINITHPTEYEGLIADTIMKCIQSVNLEKPVHDED